MQGGENSETRPSPRRTRQQSRIIAGLGSPPGPQPSTVIDLTQEEEVDETSHQVRLLPRICTSSVTGLSQADQTLFRKTQRWLECHDVQAPPGTNPSVGRPLIDATLIFTGQECGTAICIDASGLVLTCAHCVGESSEELDIDEEHLLLFSSGRAVLAKAVTFDFRRDLALLQITSAQHDPSFWSSSTSSTTNVTFPAIRLADVTPRPRERLLCAGHPAAEDLETPEEGVETGYDVIVVSEGSFRGCAKGQDVHDNSDIGALMHSCWTYWGHSGAPLVGKASGRLVGLHSSWDEDTGMRRGVAWEAISAFLATHRSAI